MENQDKELWRIAKKRAGFKRHASTYLVVNAFLWAIWLLTDKNYTNGIPWPAWCTVGWGIGLAFSYFDAYQNSGGVEREYEKLKREREGQ